MEHYPPTGVTSPGHWRDSTPTGNCGGNSPLSAHQSDCHNPRRKSSSDSGPNSYLPPLTLLFIPHFTSYHISRAVLINLGNYNI
uniref:Uncharacterized protein n=1 Tax=Magallana gigas TaxID=29159 RepID=A0A8W8JYY0_MAGGI